MIRVLLLIREVSAMDAKAPQLIESMPALFVGNLKNFCKASTIYHFYSNRVRPQIEADFNTSRKFGFKTRLDTLET